MNVRTTYAVIFAFLFLSLLPLAQISAAQTIALQAGKDVPGAMGEVDIQNHGDQTTILVTASGLRANAIYTVWLVNEKPRMEMAGLGTAGYTFTSDSQGAGQYSADLSAADFKKWQLIKIAYHPDRNARNMGSIVIDLQGTLK